MINKENVTSVAVLGGASADQLSTEGVVKAITSEQLASLPLFGLTFGAWVSLFIGMGVIFVTITNGHKLYKQLTTKKASGQEV